MKVYGQIYRNNPYDTNVKLYGIFDVAEFYVTHMYKSGTEIDGESYCICFYTTAGGQRFIRSEEGAGYPLYLANNIMNEMLESNYVNLDRCYMKIFSTNLTEDLEDPEEE